MVAATLSERARLPKRKAACQGVACRGKIRRAKLEKDEFLLGFDRISLDSAISRE